MVKITYISPDGTAQAVDANAGGSVMEAALLGNVTGIVAECGGGCSCATCHVYVDEEWLDRVEPAEPEERDLLEFLDGVQANSRLSCQLQVHEGIDGLVVRTPPEQG